MFAPLGVQRNASRAQCEGRAKEGCPKSAAEGIIEAGAPAFGCTVHPLRLQAPRAAYAHKSPGQGDCTATPGWPGGRDGRKSIKSKIIDTTATDSAIVGNMPHLFQTASPARNASNESAGRHEGSPVQTLLHHRQHPSAGPVPSDSDGPTPPSGATRSGELARVRSRARSRRTPAPRSCRTIPPADGSHRAPRYRSRALRPRRTGRRRPRSRSR